MKNGVCIGCLLALFMLIEGCGNSGTTATNTGGGTATGGTGGTTTVKDMTSLPNVDVSNYNPAESNISGSGSISVGKAVFRPGQKDPRGCRAIEHTKMEVKHTKRAQLDRCYFEAMFKSGLIPAFDNNTTFITDVVVGKPEDFKRENIEARQGGDSSGGGESGGQQGPPSGGPGGPPPGGIPPGGTPPGGQFSIAKQTGPGGGPGGPGGAEPHGPPQEGEAGFFDCSNEKGFEGDTIRMCARRTNNSLILKMYESNELRHRSSYVADGDNMTVTSTGKHTFCGNTMGAQSTIIFKGISSIDSDTGVATLSDSGSIAVESCHKDPFGSGCTDLTINNTTQTVDISSHFSASHTQDVGSGSGVSVSFSDTLAATYNANVGTAANSFAGDFPAFNNECPDHDPTTGGFQQRPATNGVCEESDSGLGSFRLSADGSARVIPPKRSPYIQSYAIAFLVDQTDSDDDGLPDNLEGAADLSGISVVSRQKALDTDFPEFPEDADMDCTGTANLKIDPTDFSSLEAASSISKGLGKAVDLAALEKHVARCQALDEELREFKENRLDDCQDLLITEDDNPETDKHGAFAIPDPCRGKNGQPPLLPDECHRICDANPESCKMEGQGGAFDDADDFFMPPICNDLNLSESECFKHCQEHPCHDGAQRQ